MGFERFYGSVCLGVYILAISSHSFMVIPYIRSDMLSFL